ncbi:DUF2721 domain-containing protein [Pararoseomonas sp. SCSIO 73927]|uniref:DUF2721 domain-containing protein n=1 Tax=Pararoseomonas sp. SCSIO 73927 TaxID=3114537 RepID=UPI0030D54667
MLEDPLSPLSFTAGTAILTNACAIMQNGATTRYSLAITQWREFHASLSAGDGRLAQQYLDADAALALAERRVRLQLKGLGLLGAASALFAATTVACLSGAFLVRVSGFPATPFGFAVMAAGGVALLLLLASTVAFFRETSCGRALLVLHRHLGDPAGTGGRAPGAGLRPSLP